MTRARSSLVSVADTPYYHCIGRCVRRAFLCGVDRLTGQSFAHRRRWILDRLRLLTEVFAIDLCAYAIMGNHYHLVVRLAPERTTQWSDAEVIDRWTRLFAGPSFMLRHRAGEAVAAAEQDGVSAVLSIWRSRLGDLSWFMRCLNEAIARQANAEDRCTGRFWEGRYRCQALLDEGALLTAMAYVDLNPVRAGMATSVLDSDFTAAQARLFDVARRRQRHQSERCSPSGPILLAFLSQDPAEAQAQLPFHLQDYLDLLDTTGRAVVAGRRGAIGESVPTLLATLGIDPLEWLPTVTQLQARFELVIGAPQRLRRLAEAKGRRWFRGRAAALKLYTRANC